MADTICYRLKKKSDAVKEQTNNTTSENAENQLNQNNVYNRRNQSTLNGLIKEDAYIHDIAVDTVHVYQELDHVAENEDKGNSHAKDSHLFLKSRQTRGPPGLFSISNNATNGTENIGMMHQVFDYGYDEYTEAGYLKPCSLGVYQNTGNSQLESSQYSLPLEFHNRGIHSSTDDQQALAEKIMHHKI